MDLAHKFFVNCFFIFVILLSVASHGHDHDHHGHTHEPPHNKYSREANEAHSHGHAHGHTHDHHGHGHAHDHHGHAHEHHGHTHEHHEKGDDHQEPVHEQNHEQDDTKASVGKNDKSSSYMLWIEALGSTLLVSCAPVFILLLIPIDKTNNGELSNQPLLNILLSFASGGLLGDAFLHLIPHALSPHSHDDHSHSHAHSHSNEDHPHDHSHDINVGLWVLSGIVAFLIVEKVVRNIKQGSPHSHSHTHNTGKDKSSATNSEDEALTEKDEKKTKKGSVDDKKDDQAKVVTPEKDDGEIAVAGYLNLAADFTHNFTDGLAIGASYLGGRTIGIITTITILLHEVPHEVGDFAILVQSGCSKRKAMKLQFSTAIGAMLGTVISLLAEGLDPSAVSWILPFTAGGFIYIATVSVIPELLQNCELKQSIKEIFALMAGVMMMVFIAGIE